MSIKLRKINCGHRRAGHREKAIEIVFVTPDGKRRPVGQLCHECVTAFDVEGLRRLAILYTGQALSRQPRLGEVQIVFDGAADVFSCEQRMVLLEGLETDLQISAEQIQEILDRAGYRSLSHEELARRVTFKV